MPCCIGRVQQCETREYDEYPSEHPVTYAARPSKPGDESERDLQLSATRTSAPPLYLGAGRELSGLRSAAAWSAASATRLGTRASRYISPRSPRLFRVSTGQDRSSENRGARGRSAGVQKNGPSSLARVPRDVALPDGPVNGDSFERCWRNRGSQGRSPRRPLLGADPDASLRTFNVCVKGDSYRPDGIERRRGEPARFPLPDSSREADSN